MKQTEILKKQAELLNEIQKTVMKNNKIQEVAKLDSKEFIKKIFTTGEATKEEIVKFMIKNYFIQGYATSDFEEDLLFKYNKSEQYAKALRQSFENELNKYCNS